MHGRNLPNFLNSQKRSLRSFFLELTHCKHQICCILYGIINSRFYTFLAKSPVIVRASYNYGQRETFKIWIFPDFSPPCHFTIQIRDHTTKFHRNSLRNVGGDSCTTNVLCRDRHTHTHTETRPEINILMFQQVSRKNFTFRYT